MKNSVPFQCVLKLIPIGANIVSASVDFSFPLGQVDRGRLSCRVVDDFLVDCCSYLLDSGAFVLVAPEALSELTPRICLPARDDYEKTFTLDMELSDGDIHPVEVTLSQSIGMRFDYYVGQTLNVVLHGSLTALFENENEE